MKSLGKKQIGVAKGMALAAVYALALLALAVVVVPNEDVVSVGQRTALAARWMLLPALTLLAGIAFIARHRFFHKDAIDGKNANDDVILVSAQAYLQNTLEQLVLFGLVLIGYVHVVPDYLLNLVPIICVSFMLCRLLFAIGYARGAAARAFGFAGTFYPTVMLFVLAIWFWVSG